jgi:hypothetical protein
LLQHHIKGAKESSIDYGVSPQCSIPALSILLIYLEIWRKNL